MALQLQMEGERCVCVSQDEGVAVHANTPTSPSPFPRHQDTLLPGQPHSHAMESGEDATLVASQNVVPAHILIFVYPFTLTFGALTRPHGWPVSRSVPHTICLLSACLGSPLLPEASVTSIRVPRCFAKHLFQKEKQLTFRDT